MEQGEWWEKTDGKLNSSICKWNHCLVSFVGILRQYLHKKVYLFKTHTHTLTPHHHQLSSNSFNVLLSNVACYVVLERDKSILSGHKQYTSRTIFKCNNVRSCFAYDFNVSTFYPQKIYLSIYCNTPYTPPVDEKSGNFSVHLIREGRQMFIQQ